VLGSKELLGGHLCLRGNVPAVLLSIGKPENFLAMIETAKHHELTQI
jgi:hypothetical protein